MKYLIPYITWYTNTKNKECSIHLCGMVTKIFTTNIMSNIANGKVFGYNISKYIHIRLNSSPDKYVLLENIFEKIYTYGCPWLHPNATVQHYIIEIYKAEIKKKRFINGKEIPSTITYKMGEAITLLINIPHNL